VKTPWFCILLLTASLHAQTSAPHQPAQTAAHAQVVMLGTGNPNPDPERSGPSVAVVVNGSAYLVDAGPGVVRRAAAASRKGIPALEAPKLKIVFLTHLHSDHTLGLPDLQFSSWTMGRTEPLQVYGPSGTKRMMQKIADAWAEDIAMRLRGGEPSNQTGYRAAATEIKAGVVYRDANVVVTAFAVPHGSWKQAFGYRFDTFVNGQKDRSIVISGDTTYSADIAQICDGCDVLVHEVYSAPALAKREPAWQAYHSRYHTSAGDLAKLAAAARPKLLVLYHQLMWTSSEEQLLKEVQQGYGGQVVSAKDLDVF
jgi:ribonuclease BN (tRNA processing enzyme)